MNDNVLNYLVERIKNLEVENSELKGAISNLNKRLDGVLLELDKSNKENDKTLFYLDNIVTNGNAKYVDGYNDTRYLSISYFEDVDREKKLVSFLEDNFGIKEERNDND